MEEKSAVQSDGLLAIPPALKDRLRAGTLWLWQQEADGSWRISPEGDVGEDDWYWTSRTQEGLYQSELDLQAGRYTKFADGKSAMAHLKYLREAKKNGLNKKEALSWAQKQMEENGYFMELGPGYDA